MLPVTRYFKCRFLKCVMKAVTEPMTLLEFLCSAVVESRPATPSSSEGQLSLWAARPRVPAHACTHTVACVADTLLCVHLAGSVSWTVLEHVLCSGVRAGPTAARRLSRWRSPRSAPKAWACPRRTRPAVTSTALRLRHSRPFQAPPGALGRPEA